MSSEPKAVRYVRWHPEHGYRWDDTRAEFMGDIARTGWIDKPLYDAEALAALRAEVEALRGDAERFRWIAKKADEMGINATEEFMGALNIQYSYWPGFGDLIDAEMEKTA